MTDPGIVKDVTYRRSDAGVKISLEFTAKHPDPDIWIHVKNEPAVRFELDANRFKALEQLLQAARDHQSQLRYEEAAAKRLAERQAADLPEEGKS